MAKYNLKRDPNKPRGDTLEIKVKDINLNVYFRETVNINDKKKMLKLLNDLKEKGITFPISWFE